MRLFTPALTWGGWTHNPQELRPGSLGILEFAKDTANGGIVSELVPIEAGGLYRFGLLLGDEGDPHAVGLNLRVLDDKGEWIGQTRALPGARTDFDCFVPHRTYGVRLAVVAATPKTGARVAVLNLTVDRIDPADYYRLERDSRSVPVIAAMASIPSRRQMLRDAVESLLLQCDLVRVFLNEYPDVPEFLDHARIQVRRSQDWDDKGDAGKFGWIDAQDEPGYRIAADDDLIFPPDFARRMIRVLERHANRAIAAAHGVYVKQPFAHYYDRESRSVIYFQEALERERSVHILGTNALMYHSVFVKMTWDDFMFRNMADIFLARYAQKNRIPMICADRPRLWVRQNTQEGGFESIYESSRLRNRSKFDSSLVQDGVLKHIAPLTVQATMRRKAAICLLATDPAAVDALLASWARSRSTETDWVLIAAAATEDPALREHVAAIHAPTELHIISDVDLTPAARVFGALSLAVKLGADCVCLALDCVRFTSDAWVAPAGGGRHRTRPTAIFAHAGGEEARSRLRKGSPAIPPVFFLFDRAALGPDLLAQPREHGVAAALRTLRSRLAVRGAAASIARESTDALATCLRIEAAPPALEKLAAAHAKPRRRPANRPPAAARGAFNRLFERINVINLARRPDRWDQISRGLHRAGIRAERVAAVDGASPEIAAEYAAYASQPLTVVSPAVRPITSSKDFYFHYESQRSRVAFVEARSGRKAIASAGAWAYLKTWETILERALVDQIETLLVFDDDVVFHRRSGSIFRDAVRGLSDDWLMLQLGTMQFHWEGEWMQPCGTHLYRTNGSAVGSHAVGVRLELIPFLLEHVKRMELPFDTGAVSAATRAFKERCFVVSPNVAIQRLTDSDIGTSDFQATRKRGDIAKTHRWVLEDYIF